MALDRVKVLKAELRKVELTVSTINFRIVDRLGGLDVLENEAIDIVAYAAVVKADPKRFAFVYRQWLWSCLMRCADVFPVKNNSADM